MITLNFTPEQFKMLKDLAEDDLTDMLGGILATEEDDEVLSEVIDVIEAGAQARNMRTRCENAYGEPFHYFASSVAKWKTSTDLDDIIADMKRDGFPFNVFRVDLPGTATYKINQYQPQVAPERLRHVGFWEIVPEEEPT